MTEEELASKCKLADNQARKELYELYGGSLMAICLRYTGDREAAEDVLHDGFVRIFQSIGQFTYQGVGSLKAWLSRVMVNEALGYLRKRNQLAQQEVLMEQLPDTEEDDDFTCVGLDRTELEYMDEDERREAIEDAGLDPDDYDFD